MNIYNNKNELYMLNAKLLSQNKTSTTRMKTLDIIVGD